MPKPEPFKPTEKQLKAVALMLSKRLKAKPGDLLPRLKDRKVLSYIRMLAEAVPCIDDVDTDREPQPGDGFVVSYNTNYPDDPHQVIILKLCSDPPEVVHTGPSPDQQIGFLHAVEIPDVLEADCDYVILVGVFIDGIPIGCIGSLFISTRGGEVEFALRAVIRSRKGENPFAAGCS
jgi:hypothetical protein